MNSSSSNTRKALALIAGIFGALSCARAQHYVPGTEGIRAATLPPPGLYLQDYNFYRWADNVIIPTTFSAHNRVATYDNEPRLSWITNWKILGATYGMDLIVPFKYTSLCNNTGITIHGRTLPTQNENHSGLADVEFAPLLLDWQLKHFEFTAGYAFWAPTGDYRNQAVNVGEGFWTQMFTVGGTWYPDEEKTWAVSLLNHFEINSEFEEHDLVPLLGHTVPYSHDTTIGSTYTLEWGVSKILCPHIEIGGGGYYQKQFTSNKGADQGPPLEIVALGPEITSSWPKWGFSASLRYDCEIYAQNQSPSKLLALTLTERF